MYIVLHVPLRGKENVLYNSKYNLTSTAKGFLKLLLFKNNLCGNKDAPFKYLVNVEFQWNNVSWT